jgi:glycosyltransferase involved in cell wall biosynthesis
MTQVSVIIPFYGNHRGREVIDQVISAWLDQDAPCEVIVVTSGDVGLAEKLPRDADGRVRLMIASDDLRAPGLLRNVGAFSSVGEWLYLTDSDIAPMGRDYLRKALAMASTDAGIAFAKPKMLRLIGPMPTGVASRWRVPDGSAGCCFVRQGQDGILATYQDESVFVLDEGHLWVDPPGDLVTAPGEERRRAALHWGGMLVRRADFSAVGGYCGQYKGWGSEDVDLLVKLGSRNRVIMAWKESPSLMCIHFEHPRPYDATPSSPNRSLFTRRKEKGPSAMIEEDLQWLRGVLIPSLPDLYGTRDV